MFDLGIFKPVIIVVVRLVMEGLAATIIVVIVGVVSFIIVIALAAIPTAMRRVMTAVVRLVVP